MYEEGKTKWFSQTLLTYKDKIYASDGYFRVSISTNTEDFKFFNPPSFSISIKNNYQKTCNMNYQDIIDLHRSFEDALKGLNGNDIEIVKNIRDIRIYFKFTNVNDDRVVKATLENNSTDLTSVVFPLIPTFQAFLNLLKYYKESYPEICKNLFMKSIDSESILIIHQLPSLIKGISSQIINSDYLDTSAPNEEPPQEYIEKTEQTIGDLDKFIGDDMSNINIPEIDEGKVKPKENISEVKSIFVENVLKNDLYNLESLLNSQWGADNPWISIWSEISNQLDAGEDFKITPSLSENDFNSISYISKLIFVLTNLSYRTLGNVIPSGFPVLKYKVDEFNEINRDIALDLLLFNAFLRCFRRKIESKDSNADKNGSFLYMMFRCFTDPISFSILEKCDQSSLKNVVINRYKYYDKIGVFDFYKKQVESYNCPSINISDIESFVDEIQDKIIGKTPFIDEYHKEEYAKGQLKLPYEGKFNSEQIINKIVPVEASIKMGEEVEEACNTKDVGDEIRDLFCGKEKKKQQPKVRKESNLERFIRGDNLNEIPEKYREDFQKYIKGFGDKNFEFGNEFPYDEFGESIIQALYIWKPEDDEKIKTNFAYFTKKFSDVIHTKESILTGKKEESKSSGGWDEIQF